MVYSLQFIIQFMVYGTFMVYGLQFTVYHSWRTRTVYDNVDGPTQNLSTKQFCIAVCALALYGMLPVVLYDGLRYT